MHRLVRRTLAILLVVVVVALVGTTVVAYALDRVDSARILPGTTVAGVEIGGLTAQEAVHRVASVLDPPLSRSVTIRAGTHSLRVVPAALGVRPLVAAAVHRATERSRSMAWMPRSYGRLFGWSAHISIPVHYLYPRHAVARIVAGLANKIASKPRSASLEASLDDARIVATHSRDGTSLDQAKAVARIMRALRDGASTVTLPITVVRPNVPDAKLGKTITVDLTTNTLRLYTGFRVIRTYPVATATQPFSTPIGTWQVVQKELHPVWVNPGDAWAAGMPAVIPAGPDNPLGLRALGLSAPGVFIHGTPEDWSVGHYASHGCIRMHETDALALYPLVPVGTKVIIFGAPPWGATTVAGAPPGF